MIAVAGQVSHANPDELSDFARRSEQVRRRFHGRQPKRAGDVIAQVVQRRGYAQVRQAQACEEAWRNAAGQFAQATRAGACRRGVLEVFAANSLVMQELAFEKDRLLAAVQRLLPDAGVKQIRFKVGPVG